MLCNILICLCCSLSLCFDVAYCSCLFVSFHFYFPLFTVLFACVVSGNKLEMSNGGVEFSFEALGKKETAEQCFEMLCPGGVATVIGMIPEGQKVEVMGSGLLSEKTLQAGFGSSIGR